MKKNRPHSAGFEITAAVVLLLIYLCSVYIFHFSLFSGSLIGRMMAGMWLIGCILIWFAICHPKRTGKTQPDEEDGMKAKYKTCADLLKKQTISSMPPEIRKVMRKALEMNELMELRTKRISDSLHSYFGGSLISYNKFMTTVHAVENLYFENTEKMARRAAMCEKETNQQAIDQALADLDARIQENQQIETRMDKLYVQINHLEQSSQPVSDLPAMQELRELIDQTKLYQQNH